MKRVIYSSRETACFSMVACPIVAKTQVKRRPRRWSCGIAIRARAEMAPFIAEKGSITVEGVSLTVNDVRDRAEKTCDFMLNIIPHTGEVTTLGALKVGDEVNLEIDVLARYLKRMQGLA